VYFFHSRARLALLREDAGRAARAATEAQLRLLQSQLEPHMLFNTLANLRVLIGSDPPRAQMMLDRLIGFLRATLAASRRSEHTLAEEFERLADYLSLMTVRMGARLQVEFHLPDELRSANVPTLLLQPLVENSIRHGLEPEIHGGRVAVRAHGDGDALVLTVSDTGTGLAEGAPPAGSGFGLKQVRERLANVYGDRASLRIESGDGGGTRVSVRLPLSG
jgi:LytS/YehU family sensor histidine kinase